MSGTAILGAGIFAKEGIHHDYAYLILKVHSLTVVQLAHLPALKALGSLAPKLKAVYSRSEKSARLLAAEVVTILNTTPDVYYDDDPSSNLDVLLARPDISSVIIVLPITQQPSIVLKALAAGKHCLSEKPISADVASGIKLIAQYEDEFKPRGLVWRVAENYEAEPGHIAAGRAIAAGKIGKVIFFESRTVNYIDQDSKWYKTPWRTIPDVSSLFPPYFHLLSDKMHAFTPVASVSRGLPGKVALPSMPLTRSTDVCEHSLMAAW